MSSKILTLLGFASKAGKLSYGMSDSLISLKKGTSQMVISASDTSEKSKKELIFHAQKYNTEYFVFNNFTAETLSHSVGRRCTVISVNDKGFADAVLKLCKESI